MIRPTRAKTRRLRVLVITVRSPRPIRAVQRARLCAITCEARRRHVVQPVTRMREDLGFVPRYDLVSGLRDYVKWRRDFNFMD